MHIGLVGIVLIQRKEDFQRILDSLIILNQPLHGQAAGAAVVVGFAAIYQRVVVLRQQVLGLRIQRQRVAALHQRVGQRRAQVEQAARLLGEARATQMPA